MSICTKEKFLFRSLSDKKDTTDFLEGDSYFLPPKFFFKYFYMKELFYQKDGEARHFLFAYKKYTDFLL